MFNYMYSTLCNKNTIENFSVPSSGYYGYYGYSGYSGYSDPFDRNNSLSVIRFFDPLALKRTIPVNAPVPVPVNAYVPAPVPVPVSAPTSPILTLFPVSTQIGPASTSASASVPVPTLVPDIATSSIPFNAY